MKRGIRRPGSDSVVEPSPRIRFLGVWDVVAAFGLANLGDDLLNIGHHLSLPRSNLQHCFHAMALDERRLSFPPTRLPGAVEVWFRGVHSDVGGGNGNSGLNDIALKWMMKKAKWSRPADRRRGHLQPEAEPAAAAMQDHKLPLKVRLISAIDRRHYTVSPGDGYINPPSTCAEETEADEQVATEIGAKGLEAPPRRARTGRRAVGTLAAAAAKARDFALDPVRDALLTLLQARIPLADQRRSTGDGAAGRASSRPDDDRRRPSAGVFRAERLFFNEALPKVGRLFPLTD